MTETVAELPPTAAADLEPQTEQDLSEAVKSLRGPVRIVGGDTQALRCKTDRKLSVAGLSGVTLYEPGALTIVVQAGTQVSEIEGLLEGERQRLAFEPIDYRGLLGTDGAPTIGGVVAGGRSGPRRIQAGACRDALLGVRFVDGTGTIVKNGGRVMKNVTGYDLVKLMAGSFGTLGVLTEVSLKVLPIPAMTATVRLEDLADVDAIKALSAALGSPYDVTGAAHLSSPDKSLTSIRLEGFEASVRYRCGQLTQLLSRFGAVHIDDDPESVSQSWSDIRNVRPFHGTTDDVWKLSVTPSDAPGLVASLPDGIRSSASSVLYDWGGGLIWLATRPGSDLRASLPDLRGHATPVRASDSTRKTLGMFHPQPAPVERLSRQLRARFDPDGRFNPGLMHA